MTAWIIRTWTSVAYTVLKVRDTWSKYLVDDLKSKSFLLPKFNYLATFQKEGANSINIFPI